MVGLRRASTTLMFALVAVGCGLDTSGLMEVAPDATPPADGGGTPVVDASVPRGDDGGPPGDAVVADVKGHVDASPVDDAGHGSGDGGTITEGGGVSDAPATGYPTSCAQADAGSSDQDVTLYVGGDPNEPWTAHCSGGNAYLPLASATSNFSSYPGGGCASNAHGPSTVTTTWTMLRIDPATLVVDTSDYKGATSSGDTHEVSGNGSVNTDYTQMPYGSSRSCVDQQPGSPSASVDLTGTPFAVASSQQWYLLGFSNANPGNKPFGGASPASGKTVSLSVGGYPAGITPCQSDYYQTTGGACLQLVYAP
jgi:hypothetical protein